MPQPTTTAAPTTTFDPKGKSFSVRRDAFLADALKSYGLTIRRDSGRTVQWQHKHHVAHMFLYNKYRATVPANFDKGERTISWKYLQNPAVVWGGGVSQSDFLRTKTGAIPARDKKGWLKGREPDLEKTKARARSILAAAGIGSGGQAMVSAGLKPCGEPCKCGAGRSKHLADEAADLNSIDLGLLKGKLTAAKAGDLDTYLKRFGLCRPLLNHPTSPEAWHVEAMP